MRTLYESGPEVCGFFPGDSVFELNWFAFTLFDKHHATFQSAVQEAGLELAAAERDFRYVTDVWRCRNRFFDVEARLHLSIYELRPTNSGILRFHGATPLFNP